MLRKTVSHDLYFARVIIGLVPGAEQPTNVAYSLRTGPPERTHTGINRAAVSACAEAIPPATFRSSAAHCSPRTTNTNIRRYRDVDDGSDTAQLAR